MDRPHQYVVVRQSGEWKISFQGRVYGPYPSQQAATRAAVDAAHEAKTAAEVVVQGEDNRFRTEWTYGTDPYPPPG